MKSLFSDSIISIFFSIFKNIFSKNVVSFSTGAKRCISRNFLTKFFSKQNFPIKINTLVCLIMLYLPVSCGSKKLPILGEPDVTVKTVDGKQVEEKTYPVIPEFSFQDQNNQTVTQQNFKNKIYIADFFFTTCPTICPVMKKNMLLVYDQFKDDPEIRILSHTIDPEHDTPAVLHRYARDLGVSGNMWYFVSGNREKIYEIGERHYMVSARPDPGQPGGFIHNGTFVLVDKNKHVRGMYDGTSMESTKQLIRDIRNLQDEN